MSDHRQFYPTQPASIERFCTTCGSNLHWTTEHLTQDETAEQWAVEIAKAINDINRARGHVLKAHNGTWDDVMPTFEMAAIISKHADSRLSAACPECNHPIRWHDNADGHWCMACVGRASETRFKLAEKELERIREATNELIHCVGKIAEQEGQEWRLAHPELIDAYSAAILAALGEAQKGTKQV